MTSDAKTVQEYLDGLPTDRRPVIEQLRREILDNLPAGFEETIGYGMLGYVVPKSIYPSGYKAKPSEPLPLIALASQKNHIAVYHMAIYMQPELLKWFTDEYTKLNIGKPDIGKSCIRFKNPARIPYQLIGELSRKISVEDYIRLYEGQI
jgi:hypothetical protein